MGKIMMEELCEYCKNQILLSNKILTAVFNAKTLRLSKTSNIEMFFSPVGHYPDKPVGALYGISTSDQARKKFAQIFKKCTGDKISCFKKACIESIYLGEMRDNLIEYIGKALGLFSLKQFSCLSDVMIKNQEFFSNPEWYLNSPLMLSQAVRCASLKKTNNGYSSRSIDVPIGDPKFKKQFDCLNLTFEEIKKKKTLRFAFFQGNSSVFKKYTQFLGIKKFIFDEHVIAFNRKDNVFQILNINEICRNENMCYITSIPHCSNNGLGALTFRANGDYKTNFKERRAMVYNWLVQVNTDNIEDSVKYISEQYDIKFKPDEEGKNRLNTVIKQTLVARKILLTL